MIYLKRFIFANSQWFSWITPEKCPKMWSRKKLSTLASLTILQLKSLQWEIYCFKTIYEFICWVRCIYKQSMLKIR